MEIRFSISLVLVNKFCFSFYVVFILYFVRSFNWHLTAIRNKESVKHIAALALTYLQFPLKLKFQSSHRGIDVCVRQYFLFSFKQARICNDMVIRFLRPAVSRPHTGKKPFNVRLTCRRSKNVLSDEGQFVINVHSVVREFIVSEA